VALNQIEISSLRGLYLQQNSFNVPEGGLEEALNVIIDRDYMIRARRGFFSFNTPVGTPNNLFFYDTRLINILNNNIKSLNSSGSPTTLTGSAVSLTGIKSRASQANGNFYFTTDNGVLKIENSTTSSVFEAGIPQALNLDGILVGSNGPFENNKQIAYRLVFGRKDSNNNLLLGAPSDILILVNTTGGDKSVQITSVIPDEIDSTDYFYQIYRSSLSADANTIPQADFKLVVENKVTSQELTSKLIVYTDEADSIFLGAELYTNPGSQQGELQANNKPPKAKDLTIFKNHLLYANTETRHVLQLNLVSVDPSILISGDNISIVGAATRTYIARSGVGNYQTTGTTTFATTTITVTFASHGLVTGDTIYSLNAVGTGTLPNGSYVITAHTANTFDFVVATAPTTLTALDFFGVKDSTNRHIFQLYTAGSLSVNIERTSKQLTKAINFDPDAEVYAKYISGFSDVPGKISLQAIDFGNGFSVTANTVTSGTAFSPELPASGTSISSDNNVGVNVIYSSKIGEPEAVPLLNSYEVGSKNSAILRIAALRDSVIILKTDGVYRLDGDDTSSFVITVIDTTVSCIAENSVVILNNKVYALTTQGMVEITDSSVSIISRDIESPIAAVLGNVNLAAQTTGVAYESERVFLLTTLLPNRNTATTTYCYNYITKAWSQWDTLAIAGIVGPQDTLYYIGTDSIIYKERKNSTKIDYCGQDYSMTVSSVSSDKLMVIFSGTSVVPEKGDVIEKDGFINRVETIVVGPTTVTCTFRNQVNLVAADSVKVYSRYTKRIKFAPIGGGRFTQNKHFSIFQALFRSASCSRATVYFSNEKFGGSESVIWESWRQQAIGWGNEPWGLFGWGESEIINIDYTTLPNIHMRTYIPRFAARGIYLQPTIEHREAAETFFLQAIGLSVRGYSERTTK